MILIKKFLQTHPPITKAKRLFFTLHLHNMFQPWTGSSSIVQLHLDGIVRIGKIFFFLEISLINFYIIFYFVKQLYVFGWYCQNREKIFFW
jgi:hypothetical protein